MVENALKFLVDYHKDMAIIHKANYELEYQKYLAVQSEKAKYLELLDPEFKFKPKARRDDWANLNIYSHNLSSFDGTFILKAIINFFPSDSIDINWDKNKRFISIKVSFVVNIKNEETGKRTKKTLTITFLDSLRLLPAPLLDLSIAFSNNNKNLIKSK